MEGAESARSLSITQDAAHTPHTHLAGKCVRELDILGVPCPDSLRQLAVALAQVRRRVVVSHLGLKLAQLRDPLLQLHLLLKDALPERACMLKLLFLVVEELLEIDALVAVDGAVGRRGHGAESAPGCVGGVGELDVE